MQRTIQTLILTHDPGLVTEFTAATDDIGDDVRIAFRDVGMDPDFSDMMRAHGLASGDRPGTALLPKIWSTG